MSSLLELQSAKRRLCVGRVRSTLRVMQVHLQNVVHFMPTQSKVSSKQNRSDVCKESFGIQFAS